MVSTPDIANTITVPHGAALCDRLPQMSNPEIMDATSI